AVLARGSVRACAEAVGVDTGWLAAVLATERASGVDGGEGLTSGVRTQAGSFPPIIVGRVAGCVVRTQGRSFPPIIVGRVAAFGTSLRGAEAEAAGGSFAPGLPATRSATAASGRSTPRVARA